MPRHSQVFKGLGASEGIAVGRVFLIDRRQAKVPRYHVEPDQTDYEVQRLHDAVERSVAQLQDARSRFKGEGLAHDSILEAHEMMLRDQALFSEAEALIRSEQRNAEWAVNRVIGRIRSLLERVNDDYFRERRTDVDFVGERILKNLTGQVTDVADVADLGDGSIIVAHDLSPVDTALLSRHRITAFVTEVGGVTSHTSIIARSLEVPAVVGAHGVFEAAGSGDMIVVDGFDGTAIIRPTRQHLARARKRSARFERRRLDLLEARALPARTLDSTDVHIAGNIELPQEVATVMARGGQSIGLYRTEFMFVGRQAPPGEEEHYRTYCRIFDEVGDMQVTIRTLDLGGDKLFGSSTFEPETNPALGLRAIRYCLRHPELFEPQIAGLLRAAPRGNLRVMLPMISGLDELRAAKDIIAQVRRRLEKEGKEHNADIPVGIMIEVPSAVMAADLLAQEADFFAIGTNDLMQYLLAIDRTNDQVSYLYHPLHPAMLRTLRCIVQAAEAADIPVSVCGEMAGDADHVAVLIGLGLHELSMNAGSIPSIKRLVRELSRSDCEQLIEEAFHCTSYPEVDSLVREFMMAKAPLSTQAWMDAENTGA